MTFRTVCPGTLTPGFDSYSPRCLRDMFDGQPVSHILPDGFRGDSARIDSASGQLAAADTAAGTPYRLKTENAANEHLTMQIAAQVFGIWTVPNAMVFTADGHARYICRTDTVGQDILRLQVPGAKTYLDIASAYAGHVSARYVEMGKMLQLVLFAFMSGCHDFSAYRLYRSPDGDYLTAPAEGFVNSMATEGSKQPADLTPALLPAELRSETYREYGHPCKADFIRFASIAGVHPTKARETVEMFATEQRKIYTLAECSYLDIAARRRYVESYRELLHRINREDRFLNLR